MRTVARAHCMRVSVIEDDQVPIVIEWVDRDGTANGTELSPEHAMVIGRALVALAYEHGAK